METQEIDKNLYIVYDDWKGDTPFPNLKEIVGSDSFNFLESIVDFYERFYHEQLGYDRYTLPTHTLKISEVKNYLNKKLFYPIKTSLSLGNLFANNNLNLKPNVVNELQNNPNFYFLYIREHESETIEDVNILINYFNDNNIPKEKIYLISNNPLLLNISIENNITFYKLNLLSLTSSSVFYELESNFIEDKIGKFAICFNKSPKIHRYSLLLYLKSKKLLKQCNWSLISKSNANESILSNYFSKNDLFKLKGAIDYFKNIDTKFSESEVGTNWINPKTLKINDSVKRELSGAGEASGGLMIPEPTNIYENSYINLVTESMFEDSLGSIHVTEKSFRPFYFYQIPLILSTYNHISYMKSEYGFDFYDDLINHSYDEEPNQIKRMKLYTEEVSRVFENMQDVKKYYKSNKKRFESNKKIVENLPNDTRDYLFFKSLMS